MQIRTSCTTSPLDAQDPDDTVNIVRTYESFNFRWQRCQAFGCICWCMPQGYAWARPFEQLMGNS